MHDGETFGVQEIMDRGVRLSTSFVKREGGEHGGEWTARDPIQLKNLGLCSSLKNSLRFIFDSDTCLNYKVMEFFSGNEGFLSVGNLKPKLTLKFFY